jgi:hypothetical protein
MDSVFHVDVEAMFNASKFVYTAYGVFFKGVIDELGEEKAYEIYMKTGRDNSEWLRDLLGDEKDLVKLATTLHDINYSVGLDSDIVVESDDSVVCYNKKCPRYNGFKAAGLTDDQIKRHCTSGIMRGFEKNLKRVDPSLRMNIRKWDAPNNLCEEHIFKVK